MNFTPTVVFDFDGCINSYASGWQGVDIIDDPVVPGIKGAIDDIRAAGYKVVVVSTRCADPNGMGAVRKYLRDNDITVDDVMKEKPPAIVYIDDRAICFDGHPETLPEKIRTFKNWIEEKKEAEEYMDGLYKKALSGDAQAGFDLLEVAAGGDPARTERRCKGAYFDKGKHLPVEGYFLGWGVDYEEYGTGAGCFTIALIEQYNGKVVTAPANTVEFLS